jgi:hypothetical protein
MILTNAVTAILSTTAIISFIKERLIEISHGLNLVIRKLSINVAPHIQKVSK